MSIANSSSGGNISISQLPGDVSNSLSQRPKGADLVAHQARVDHAVLRVHGVGVAFGGVQALSGVDLAVTMGTITGLIGPNGAGKTTLFNVITGLQVQDKGQVILDGEDISRLKPHKRARLGMARTFQRLETFGSMTVFENVLTAAEISKSWAHRDSSSAKDIAIRAIDRVGIGALANQRADSLPVGLARMVEVARALATNPQVLLLDEPSSGLNEEESVNFANLLIQLAKEGLALLLVEHDMEMVMRICAFLYVLDFGKLLAAGTPEVVQANPAVQAAYLGSEQ